MYSPEVLDHLNNPRNVGEEANANARGEAYNPVCGDKLFLYLNINDSVITKAQFQVTGCPPSIAAGSVLTELITNISIDEARKLTPADITKALGSLPRNKQHCSILAIDALISALEAVSSFKFQDNEI